jgi:aspartate carbamoyltransferase regulatory subunit
MALDQKGTSKDNRLLNVSAINNGTVLDHIPSRSLFKVISILKLKEIDSQITFGTNLESKKLGSKAIIKIEDKFFCKEDINKIALIAPDAKLSIIRDYKVTEKLTVEVPDVIVGIVKCFNPNCITNHEHVVSRFSLHSKQNLSLKCHYCEKITEKEQIEIL